MAFPAVEQTRALRILMLDPSGSSVNSTHNLCHHLAQLGCEVEVYTAPHWQRVAGHSVNTYRSRIAFYRRTQFLSYQAKTAIGKSFWRVFRLLQHVWVMLRLCSISCKFDVVHTQILPVPLFDCLCLRYISRRTPIVSTVHELVPHSARFRRLSGFGLGSVYRIAKVLFVFVDCTRDRLISEYGVAPERIVKVPHGSAEHMQDLRPVCRVEPAEVPVILFLGGIRLDKGLDVLIRAAACLRANRFDFKVVVAGAPGIDMRPIHELVADLGLENAVEFHLGFIPENEFAGYLRTATVVALPYRRIEQSGIAIAACTFGKAIVATRCGGLEELIREAGNGLLVPIDDPIAFADALAALLTDEEKRRIFEVRSERYAREVLSWHPIASKILSAYTAAVNEGVQPKPAVCTQE